MNREEKDPSLNSEVFSYFCDESCHLEHDGKSAMVLGAVWMPSSDVRRVAEEIRAIKAAHGIRAGFEAKWTAVSPAKYDFYAALISYFFDTSALSFRALVIRNKAKLEFAVGDSHEVWYYKMYYQLLHVVAAPPRHSRIYIDIKDTRGGPKVSKLHAIIANANYDFDHEYVERIQIVRSHEVEALQLTDLLIGAVGANERGGVQSQAKRDLIELIEERSGVSLKLDTAPDKPKFNLFHWYPRRAR
jgi:hypothetical protein